jgi:hypothetical protein
MLTLWHAFMFLGLRFFPLFFFLLGGLHCFFSLDLFLYFGLLTKVFFLISPAPRTGPAFSDVAACIFFFPSFVFHFIVISNIQSI